MNLQYRLIPSFHFNSLNAKIIEAFEKAKTIQIYRNGDQLFEFCERTSRELKRE